MEGGVIPPPLPHPLRHPRIPTGFRLKAQGCAAMRHPGKTSEENHNPNGVVANVARDEMEWPQPRCGWKICFTMTQNSSFLATLGWRPQSLWDCPQSNVIWFRSRLRERRVISPTPQNLPAGEPGRDSPSSRHATIPFRRLHSSGLLHQRPPAFAP
jgi:hypothetical protein